MSSILSMLGAGGPGPGAGPGGPPPGVPPSIQIGGGPAPSQQAGPKSDGDWQQDLRDAIAALRALANDAKDAAETNAIDKCIAALSGLQATRQKQAESAMGTTPAHKAMGRAYS